ncbi:Methyltransferase domain-containing protein [Melghirimyces algeriensis]|uniref:Methyltransferase domain-containing protein n=1 Tax=Melghirimyces algeriensis TaxID=910412 RepID=A0A521CBX6_9BACL|nr:Methyltransferase domain-containing protein [Melghirimyces algeriensis]
MIPKLMKPTNGMLLEHLARYYFSTPYVKGRVLDIACGAGYGTHMVAKACKKKVEKIIGVDLDPKTIEYARKTYYHPLTEYRVADAQDTSLPQKLGRFETILSFETIEHLQDDRLFMRHLHEMLTPGGTLVLSTPFGKGRGKPCKCPFHIHQLTPEEFVELFEGFSEVEIFYQRGVTIEPPRKNVKYPLGVAVCKKEKG